MFVAEKNTINRVIRVAVSNNFNCTAAEFAQLDQIQTSLQGSLFFVNSNVMTPKLPELNKHDYQAVITVNPSLKVTQTALNRLHKVDMSKVAFVRVKYLPAKQRVVNLIYELADEDYEVVVTPQRFNGFKGVDKYSSREYYKHSHSRMRLNQAAMAELDEIVAHSPNLNICDRTGLGCSGCGLCSTLTAGRILPIYSVNLSSSGICPFNCPDCYAKTMQHFLTNCGYNPIDYDSVKKNNKQRGSTKHIKDALQKVN